MTLETPNSGRQVVLHIGMPGSGTSALQSAFALNREELREAGIDYPHHATDAGAAHGRTTAGNASDLRHFLHRGHHDEATGSRALQRFLDQVDASDAQTILFSSEMLYHVKSDSDTVERLKSELAERNATLQIIAVVRNVAAHAQTSYAMFVKAGGFNGTFESWIGSNGKPGRYKCALRRNLEHYLTSVGQSNMRVLHYERERSDLIKAVLIDAIGAPTDIPFAYPPRPVNRRLTAHELRMIRFLNGQIANSSAAHRLSNIVMAHAPYGDPYHTMRQRDLDFLIEKYQKQVDWVNQTFFSESESVSVSSESVEISEVAAEDIPLTDETRTALEWLAELANQGKG